MKTELQESMTAGVLVEFYDPLGNTVGQAVFTGWRGRPLPAVGDTMCCTVHSTATGRREKLCGRVLSRHFELQQEEGQPCVWARLIAETRPAGETGRTAAARSLRFSTN
jgi:hypothetical protein